MQNGLINGEAIQLQRQEQQLAEDHQEREIERQEAIRQQVQQHSQYADLCYEELQAQQLIRIQRAAQEELERRKDELADQAHRAARDAVDQGGDLNELVIRQEARQPYVEPLYHHTLRNMEVECRNCGALHWDTERLTSSSRIHPKFGVCCLQGQVRLDPFQEAPAALHCLFRGVDITAHEFRDKVRSYNNAFAFTSLGVKIDYAVTSAAGPYSFRIHGV
ncbi:hypothetical protein SERLA73DRAFT_75453 [Serpula lacrymans var. lacrymans S7.3]|uniref:Helitron helicase-like domain-containing protein n=2 Tax=Serpula lacrymans var. lacrymans TaxID=341189 RepID=F8Q4T1_SERL3|nr:uncharacterized protein SERLADRAFT_440153 [Serpula lacrymans var. lacrymans S7.9]EGN96558.1 hypothetical protein SERLA73DRAFT_75453 [Serpula lacrymans var. lacrymans S7.3]EGO22134.1 hypothetical protein SERLADRAFT_440153 [Serpula lacrymans var. lacrymans S7.9]